MTIFSSYQYLRSYRKQFLFFYLFIFCKKKCMLLRTTFLIDILFHEAVKKSYIRLKDISSVSTSRNREQEMN